MKIIIPSIIGIIALALSIRAIYFLLCLILIACGGTSSKVDTAKLNAAYFIGEYQTNYRNETEKIILNENGYYDYVYGKNNDTIIKAVGKWTFTNYSTSHLSIELTNFPLLRKNRLFESKTKSINIDFDVNTSVSFLGDLYDIVGEDEDYYTFEKLDKSKNKDYILEK